MRGRSRHRALLELELEPSQRCSVASFCAAACSTRDIGPFPRLSRQTYSLVISHIPFPLLIILNVAPLSAHAVKHVNEYPHSAKDLMSLTVEVAVHIALLSTTIPEIEDEMSEEANMTVFYVQCRSESPGV